MAKYRFDSKNHIHLLDEKPLIGTSTALQVIAKNLTWWAAETSAVECLEVGEHIPTIREEYLAACASTDKKSAIDALQKKYPIFKKARFAHFADKNDKAKKGTDMHEELEKYVKFCLMRGFPEVLDTEHAAVKVFHEWAKKNVKRFIFSEAHCYSEKHLLGGIADVAWIDNEDRAIIGDFKSSKEAYQNQFFQIAGYDIQFTENGEYDSEGNRISEFPFKVAGYAVIPFGAQNPEPVLNYDTETNKKAFLAAVELFKITNK